MAADVGILVAAAACGLATGACVASAVWERRRDRAFRRGLEKGREIYDRQDELLQERVERAKAESGARALVETLEQNLLSARDEARTERDQLKAKYAVYDADDTICFAGCSPDLAKIISRVGQEVMIDIPKWVPADLRAEYREYAGSHGEHAAASHVRGLKREMQRGAP